MIDTSSTPAVVSEEKKEEEGDSSGLTTADKAIVQEMADKKYESELENIYTKIIEKSDFLIKLQVPAAYLYKDSSKKREGTLIMIKEPSQNKDGEQ